MFPQERMVIDDHRLLAELDVDKFPAAANFKIELFSDPSLSGHGLHFIDSHLGLSIEFPWWDNVDADLRRWSISDVPLGSLDQPFVDLEQGWQVLLWRLGDWVFIMQGDDEAFHTWIRVPVDRYLSEWKAVLMRQS